VAVVKQWAFAVCAAMVVCGIAHMLLPKSNLEKMFRMVISIFFLCAVLSPVIIESPALTLEIPDIAYAKIAERSRRLDETATRQALSAAKKTLEETVMAKLSQKGIKAHTVTINIITNGQNELNLQDAAVTLYSGEELRGAQIKRVLEYELGCPVALEFY